MTEQPAATFRDYGVKERSRVDHPLARQREELALVGHTRLDSGLGDETLARLRRRLDELTARQAQDFGGAEALRQIDDEHICRAPLADDPLFLEVCANHNLLALAELALGDYVILMQQNGITNPPGASDHNQAAFHRDLPYQHFVSSRPLAINALLCLDDFTEENGATLVIPGSHKVEAYPSKDTVRTMARSVTAKAGCFVVMDCMLFHSGGSNRSTSPRRAINNVLTLPFIKQQISLPRLLAGRHAEDPQLRRLLGYDSEAADSVLDWRRRRRDKASPRDADPPQRR